MPPRALNVQHIPGSRYMYWKMLGKAGCNPSAIGGVISADPLRPRSLVGIEERRAKGQLAQQQRPKP
ncbi:hypothetical protein OIDMADRAFT_20567 [Oidiodendron maius Zn]|uniref:Uncharacterized protein n=1 Tax=Oidiodendron maius (strain Zn) TaxID=913774 RepID=A0A0C3D699_OIDMZ|nr:hypothetical protein OIDMADRAFT_20567 [Oidiodendron maius Zn]